MICLKCGNPPDIQEDFLIVSQRTEHEGINGQIQRIVYNECLKGKEKHAVCKNCLEKFRKGTSLGIGSMWIISLSAFVFAVTSVVLLLEAHSFQWIGLIISIVAALLVAGALFLYDHINKKSMTDVEVFVSMLRKSNEETIRRARSEGYGYLVNKSYYYFPMDTSHYMAKGKIRKSKLRKMKKIQHLELHTDLWKHVVDTIFPSSENSVTGNNRVQ